MNPSASGDQQIPVSWRCPTEGPVTIKWTAFSLCCPLAADGLKRAIIRRNYRNASGLNRSCRSIQKHFTQTSRDDLVFSGTQHPYGNGQAILALFHVFHYGNSRLPLQ